ncbi:reverse transcriptase domain-containing protein [Tanacetum coccineum]
MFFKVDFAKAYDSVRWDYLLDVLEAFGFGRTWCNWIQGTLTSAKASILINGWLLKSYPCHRGLNQGDFVLTDLLCLNHWNSSFYLSPERVVTRACLKASVALDLTSLMDSCDFIELRSIDGFVRFGSRCCVRKCLTHLFRGDLAQIVLRDYEMEVGRQEEEVEDFDGTKLEVNDEEQESKSARELEFQQLHQDSPAEETKTESNVWDDGSEDVNPFGGGNPLLTKKTESEPIIWDIGDEEEEYPFVKEYPSFKEEPIMFVEDESCPVYDTDNEEDAEPTPKYDSDGDELVYEDEEVCLPDVGESLVIQRVLSVTPSKSIDDDSWCWNNIFRTKCTSKGKVCNMIIDEGSCENVVSTYMVEKLVLKTVDHPEPYQLTWLKKETSLRFSQSQRGSGQVVHQGAASSPALMGLMMPCPINAVLSILTCC